jgi:hypothetical protein
VAFFRVVLYHCHRKAENKAQKNVGCYYWSWQRSELAACEIQVNLITFEITSFEGNRGVKNDYL